MLISYNKLLTTTITPLIVPSGWLLLKSIIQTERVFSKGSTKIMKFDLIPAYALAIKFELQN